MKIMNIEGLTTGDIQRELDFGSRFVFFPYTLSFIIGTFRGTSGVYLVRSRKNYASRFFYTLLSFIFGWWGIPWGPKHTIAAIVANLRGGKDVTREVMAVLSGYELFEEANLKKRLN